MDWRGGGCSTLNEAEVTGSVGMAVSCCTASALFHFCLLISLVKDDRNIAVDFDFMQPVLNFSNPILCRPEERKMLLLMKWHSLCSGFPGCAYYLGCYVCLALSTHSSLMWW